MQCHRYKMQDFFGPCDSATVKKALKGTVSNNIKALVYGSGPVAPALKPEGQRVKHGAHLKPTATTTVCVDAAQSGLGGIDSWVSPPLEQYKIQPQSEHVWAFILEPFAKPEPALAESV